MGVVTLSILHNLARRWACHQLTRDNDQSRRKLIAAQAAAERLTQERDKLTRQLRLEQCTSASRSRIARRQADQIERQADRFEELRAQIDGLKRERDAAREQLQEIYHLHTDSVIGSCPSCYRANDVSDTDDGLVGWPCPTLRAMGVREVELRPNPLAGLPRFFDDATAVLPLVPVQDGGPQ